MKRAVQLLFLTVALAGFALANDTPVAVPEIDASSALGAMGLLAGAVLIFQTRRKK
jgi:hypothetical protein